MSSIEHERFAPALPRTGAFRGMKSMLHRIGGGQGAC